MLYQKGFTLVELTITVGIVAFIAAITLANFPAFRSSAALNRAGGEISVALRRAQQFALGVQRFGVDITDINDVPLCTGGLFEAQFPAYGVNFREGESGYTLYADPDCDRQSDTFNEDAIEATAFQGGVKVTDLCIFVDETQNCAGIDQIDIWYVRPSPKLDITAYIGGNIDTSSQSARIVFAAADGLREKSIIIRSTGQVTLQDEN